MKTKLLFITLIAFAVSCQNVSKKETVDSQEAVEKVDLQYAQKIELKVEGMTCTGCENAIQKTIYEFEGVYSSKADHEKGIALLNIDSTKVDISKIEEAINELGYQAKGYTKLTD